MQNVHTPKQSRKWTACKVCKRQRAECGSISLRGYCLDCAIDSSIANMRSIKRKSGEGWEKYRDGIVRYAAKLTAE